MFHVCNIHHMGWPILSMLQLSFENSTQDYKIKKVVSDNPTGKANLIFSSVLFIYMFINTIFSNRVLSCRGTYNRYRETKPSSRNQDMYLGKRDATSWYFHYNLCCRDQFCCWKNISLNRLVVLWNEYFSLLDLIA